MNVRSESSTMITIPYEDLLEKSSSVMIHHSNLQQLALNNLSSSLMSEIFTLKNTGYNLCGGNKLNSNNIKSVNNGTETISYLAPKIWEQVPDEIKK